MAASVHFRQEDVEYNLDLDIQRRGALGIHLDPLILDLEVRRCRIVREYFTDCRKLRSKLMSGNL
jgi:hypothetical protein